ncbi:PIN domain-containing protein [Rhodococcus sp. DK17]|uniref:PIN domain-containing protein n=1 Tax=Rhodococcus sp. DK17 TaxID=186196 RepID=UPI001ED8E106|nr:PIN domain-containing protein [Rhodococcus sp. DK17]
MKDRDVGHAIDGPHVRGHLLPVRECHTHLWPSLQRDFLLSLAVEGLYRPLWSDAVLEELEYHEALKLVKRGSAPAAAEAAAKKLIATMNRAFDDSMVEGWEPLEGTFGLPDVDDEHVVAAAVIGGAGAILTDNLKHFPRDYVPAAIQIVSVAEFAADTAAVSPSRALAAVETISARFHNPRGMSPRSSRFSGLATEWMMPSTSWVAPNRLTGADRHRRGDSLCPWNRRSHQSVLTRLCPPPQ